MERVVVTGLGAVSCLGADVAGFWQGLVAGKSGIDVIRSFDPAKLSSRIAGEVRNFTFDPKLGRRMDRFSRFAFVAAQQALAQAGLVPESGGASRIAPERIGVCIGTGIGGEPFLEIQHAKFVERGPGKFHPLTVPIVIANMASANIAIHFKLLGPNLCVSTACATGNHSIGLALDLIRHGRADAMLAGGTEAVITEFSVDGYAQLGALSTRNDEPQTASRPFSKGRDGFVIAEGAGVLLLESLTHARRRGAEILAEVAGFGMTADGYHLTAPHPEADGAIRAIRLALEDARLNPGDVDYINAHGTSTPLNDLLETRAVKQVFGDHARRLAISSIKSMVGHCLGGSAGLEAVASVLTLRHGILPPTINLTEPDPELDLDYVPLHARERPVRAVLSNSFAFGGHNAVIAFTRAE